MYIFQHKKEEVIAFVLAGVCMRSETGSVENQTGRICLITAAHTRGNIVFHSRTSAGQIVSQGTESDHLNQGQSKYIPQSSPINPYFLF